MLLSDVTLHVSMTPLTDEGRLLINTSETEQDAQLSQRDRAAGCVSFGQK